MAIQNLVGIAIDVGEKTSNKLKALELIGKMSEVALFTERKEHIHLHSSEDIKGKLLEGLRQAFTNSRGLNDLAKRKAESLLVELAEARTIDDPSPFDIPETATPPDPDPQKSTHSEIDSMHSILHNQSQPDTNSLLHDLTSAGGEVTIPLESDTCVSIGNYPNVLQGNEEGEGVIISGQSAPEDIQGNTPVNVSNEKA